MKVYTVQMSKHRNIPAGTLFKDITVKSGDKTFSPTWDLLMGYKRGEISPERYTELFIPLMRRSYQNNKENWLELCSQHQVALACYCRAGDFCHRHLVVDMLEKICEHHGIPFENLGEIE